MRAQELLSTIERLDREIKDLVAKRNYGTASNKAYELYSDVRDSANNIERLIKAACSRAVFTMNNGVRCNVANVASEIIDPLYEAFRSASAETHYDAIMAEADRLLELASGSGARGLRLAWATMVLPVVLPVRILWNKAWVPVIRIDVYLVSGQLSPSGEPSFMAAVRLGGDEHIIDELVASYAASRKEEEVIELSREEEDRLYAEYVSAAYGRLDAMVRALEAALGGSGITVRPDGKLTVEVYYPELEQTYDVVLQIMKAFNDTMARDVADAVKELYENISSMSSS